MYLSKLEIFGFKSFAHKNQFQYNDGITAIIGPNGCGKSNIVDAIRWVLGEQRPSLLRLDKMENVIFNGTATRKPLSMAEVSIFIENTKNILPSVYSEVKITRRLFRSGDSEYLINNRQVRLKDVIDLFADTGMGADAYSVIELKMVEQILSDNAEERRRLFEEASGIKKYKFRRKSALRKLETTRQELVRLNDVISEVQKTVNSLSRQVGKARRYHQYKEELKQQEIFGFQLKDRDYHQSLVPLREEYDQIRQTRERAGKEVNQGEAELEKLQMRSVDLENRFREVASRLTEADEKVRQIQQTVKLKEQKIESLNQNIEKNRSAVEEQKARMEDLKKQFEDLKQEKEATRQAAEQKKNEYQEKANQQLQAETHLEKLRKEYQEFHGKNINTLDRAARQREEFQKITIRKSNMEQQQERLGRTKMKLEGDLRQKEEKRAESEKDLEISRQEIRQYELEYDLLKKQITKLEDEHQPLEEEKNRLLGGMEKLKSQKEFVERLIENYEGFSEGVQYVMSRKKSYAGLIDTLANMVDTSDEYRPALESYLEEIANYLVVEGVETAKDILKEIRHQRKGRLTLVPLALLNGSSNGTPDSGEFTDDGIALKDVVRYDSRFKKLFDFLFDRVVLVKDMDTALRWHKKYPSCQFLTTEGELLGNWGQITGGNSHFNLNLTGRKQQFERAVTELSRLEKQHARIEGKLKRNREQSLEKKSKADEFDNLLKERRDDLNRLERQVGQQRYEDQLMGERLRETESELDALSGQLDELSGKEAELLPAVQEAERDQRHFREEDSRLSSELAAADHHFRQLSRRVQEMQIEYLNKKNDLNELDHKEQYLRNSLEGARDTIGRQEAEIANIQVDIEGIDAENTAHRATLEKLYRERDEIEKEKLEVENNYQSLKSIIMAREEELKKKHRRWNQALERLRELELQIREIEVKQKSQREQLEERFGQAFETLLSENPVPENVSFQQVQEATARLRQKIESLGEVNPLAIKEHEKEKERLDFLKSQQSDLLQAKEELLHTISRLNKTARQLFMDTFTKINNNFKDVFAKFFEKGEAQLRLVDNGDPLEANIDISVHLKGKRLSTLALLSAGEKTLTAISLLFAIYLVKPSPFCILDEVDAPLDDVNIARYTHALREFSRNTQFILVTHNKMTMQAAQAMYGITMEEPGVSKVVSVRFD